MLVRVAACCAERKAGALRWGGRGHTGSFGRLLEAVGCFDFDGVRLEGGA